MNGWPTPESRYNDTERALAHLDPAFAKCALALRGELRFGHGEGELLARSLPNVAAELVACRQQFDGGDAAALLAAIEISARECLPLPAWAALALRDRLRDYTDGKLRSLDEAFGSPLPVSGKKALRERRYRQLGARLRLHVVYAQTALGMTSFDAAVLYAIKECRAHVGKTKARALVLADEARQQRFFRPAVRTFSHLRRKARKS